ncbi:hypothetical protein [Chryseobacterium endophyticum]|uniref:Uncharacterized protein n=1 Tax=Chryseobacterium endophyticum TaxID=1854762 RepID=A0AAU6WU64_9FLAO|nr:hypothetical protein [uncultured Chryseobacterium sp.]
MNVGNQINRPCLSKHPQLLNYVLDTVVGLNHLDKNTSIGNIMIGYFDQGRKNRDINFNYTSGGSQVRHGISNIVDLNPSKGKR